MRDNGFRTEKWLLAVVLLVAVATAVPALVGRSAEQGQEAPRVSKKNKGIDPIELNGPIFVNWPKPDVALVFSGDQYGYIEPCGCAGLENQKGGLMRRATLLRELRDDGWPLVPMDLGGQERYTGVQAEIKYDFTLTALTKMGYDAVGFGARDLRLDLLPIVINLDAGNNPLVSAGVGIVDFDSGLTRRFRVVEAGGMKIGITSVLGKKEIGSLQNTADVTLLEPQQAIPQVLPELRAAGCDHLVLLAYAEPDEAEDLARRFPEFDWIVAAHGADEPPSMPRRIDGLDAHLIEVGRKGMYVIVVGLYNEGPTKFRYQRVPLDSRFADAPEISAMHAVYQKQLETLGWEGLGLRPTPHPTGRKFAGSGACADCHFSATEVHENTPHFHATDTLVKLTPQRHFDPECISCHAVGWEPQKYFPFESGYLGLKETPLLVGNGCENCHGPAAHHVAVESGEVDVSDDQREAIRESIRLSIVENEGNKEGQVFGRVVQMCMECHDLDNSPDFDFQTFWPQVDHPGKD